MTATCGSWSDCKWLCFAPASPWPFAPSPLLFVHCPWSLGLERCVRSSGRRVRRVRFNRVIALKSALAGSRTRVRWVRLALALAPWSPGKARRTTTNGIEPQRLGAGHARNPRDPLAPQNGINAEGAEGYDFQMGKSARAAMNPIVCSTKDAKKSGQRPALRCREDGKASGAGAWPLLVPAGRCGRWSLDEKEHCES